MSTISLLWDETELVEQRASELQETGGHACAQQDAFDMALADADLLAIAFEDFQDEFSAVLRALSPQGHFHIEGRYMGWRRLSGFLDLQADDACTFMRRAFPKTCEWTLRGIFYPEQNRLEYTLTHHDAPTGEFYTVRPAAGWRQ